MTKEEMILQRRLLDLADTAWQRGVAFFSDFLSLNEQSLAKSGMRLPDGVRAVFYGGYAQAERCIAGFFPIEMISWQTDAELEQLFPLTALCIRPLSDKYAEDLTHRDYLGALMNLGIDRAVTGDILVEEERAVLFCRESMAEYISENLLRVRHTSVTCEVMDASSIQSLQPRTEVLEGSVASFRLDAVLAFACKKSRSFITPLITQGLAFVNGRMITDTDHRLNDGDIISLRGYGKFKYLGEEKQTRKGRCIIRIEKYI